MRLLVVGGLLLLACAAGAVGEDKRFALDFHGDGTYIDLHVPPQVEGSELYEATMELMFKPNNCSLQGLMAQRFVLRPQPQAAGEEYVGPDVDAAAGEAVASRNVSQLAASNGNLRSSLRALQSGAGETQAQAPFHGRGMMVDGKGMVVVWSRDGKGVWRGVSVAECVPGAWHHVALVQRANLLQGYFDGALRKQVQMEGHQGPNYVPDFTVGRLTDGRASSFYTANSQVDEIRVFERALTPQEVRCNADTRISGRERGLAAYLKLDEGAGQTLVSTALPMDVRATLVGSGADWVAAKGSAEVQVAPDAPPADGCVYDMASAVLGAGIHMTRLRAGEGCPDECSGHGRCDMKQSKCFCFAGFIGETCGEENYQGYSLRFESAEEARVEVPPLGLHNSFMIEVWALADDVSGSRPLRADVDESAEGAVVWELVDGKPALTVVGNEPETVTFEYEVQPNEWTFLAVGYSKRHANRTGTGSATLYVNGDLHSTVVYDKTVAAQMGNWWIGGRSAAATFWQGELDELRTFSRVYSPRALAYYHQSGRLDGDEEGLLSYYRFDEGTGTLAVDGTRLGLAPQSREFEQAPPVSEDVAAPLDAKIMFAKYARSAAPFLPCPEDCNRQGRCWNGTCTCDEWWGGLGCGKEMCPHFCSGNGHCVVDNSTLRYADMLSRNISDQAGTTTDDLFRADLHRLASPGSLLYNLTLNVANATQGAVHDEVRRAIVDFLTRETPKRCQCDDGYRGVDCSVRGCPNACSGHGACFNGTCGCEPGWGGDDCSERRCLNDCSGHGECFQAICVCDAGFSGEDCAEAAPCGGGCNGHGTCLDDTCDCDAGYTGEHCEWSSGCPNFCSGRGHCMGDRCVCDALFAGDDCSEVKCPRDCSGHGDCVDGRCYCEAGYSADDCSQSALWPMRCHTVRRGKTSTHMCRRGWQLATPTIGSQVLEISYASAGGRDTFEGQRIEQDQPVIDPQQMLADAARA
eukprot:CAMPEP_0196780254 /NCGR_PEP_ID=MMETSP1104-20130614/7376_1 /TAXON_ID=33652 /ORGANISM="Cafeteria sp., Strain Caron Lab Isolate" /LENGTH=975 /DNA_ID=CAMNT_0042150451 /DNA_START=15 /DNA_END=2942 /DNA_ORIENTATION=-